METGGGASGDSPQPERLARYRWAADAFGGKRVLDAACGAGFGTALLAKRAAEAVGVDFSPAALEAARREHGGVAEFVEGDLRALPFGDGEFEAIACFEALTHLAEPERALDELRRVLRPGGLLLASAPDPTAYPAGDPLQLSEISPRELRTMLGERFAAVALYGQQPYLASLLGPAELLSAAGAERPIEARVSKLAGPPPGGALHAVAAAGDGELPPAPAELAIGEPVDQKERERLLALWRERAVNAEAEAEALRRRLRDGGG